MTISTVDCVHEPKPYMQEEAIAGMSFLDKYFEGDSWWERISLSRLDMFSPTDCVLGQLFGGYGHGLCVLHLLHGNASEEYGFTVVQPDPFKAPHEAYFIALTLTWRLALAHHAEERK